MAVSINSRTLCAEPAAVAAPEWDQLFQRTEGWTGGDAIYSVDLGNRRLLWLFADSWIGSIQGGRHAPGSRLVNNALALHPLPRAGDIPQADTVSFRWGANDAEDHPTAWIRPADSTTDWFWVADGIVTTAKSAPPRLAIFLWRMKRAGTGGVMDFRSAGGNLAIVDNPHDDWDSWQVRQFRNPHVVTPDNAGSPRQRELVWGSEVVAHDEDGQAWVLVYGYRGGGLATELVMARAPAEAIDDFARWEFRTDAGWSAQAVDCSALATGLTTEFSVTPCDLAGSRRWVLVQSEPLLGPHILARVSHHPWGPFSAPQRIYKVPGLDTQRKQFTYAAKGHPEISSPGELLITYAVNSFEFSELVNNADIYFPRFVRLRLSVLVNANH